MKEAAPVEMDDSAGEEKEPAEKRPLRGGNTFKRPFIHEQC